MSGGVLDNHMLRDVAEVHHMKSEYTVARQIYTQTIQSTSAEQNMNHLAYALLGIAQIDVEIDGNLQNVIDKLHTAKTLFSNVNYARGIVSCEIATASLKLREGDKSTARSIFHQYLQQPIVYITFDCLEYIHGQH
jgi:hypothetical protein